jgi:hypothetical protein
MKRRLAMIAAVLLSCGAAQLGPAAEPIRIDSRLELFVDHYLIERMSGDVQLHLHKPEPQEVVLVTDEPWEGNTCAYYTIFQDGDLYRMYYRGSHAGKVGGRPTHPEVTCYAESKDGIHWTKPALGIVEFQGSTENNIVWNGTGTHNFTPFKDPNPACRPDAKYKALAGASRGYKKGLYAVKSPDGVHWSLMSEEPVITKGAFDSQNLAFWDPVRKLYADFHRTFHEGVRAIMTCTSTDFLHWTEPVLLEYPGAPKEHLYTNAIRPYERAPHILIGFPTRFLPKTQQVEPTFMASRDGRTFHRWTEALIPITAPEDRDGNRSNYMTWGLVQLPHSDREYSVYATEAYYAGPDSRVRRFTYRVDGFVSARGSDQGGELVTKPLVFSGQKLVLNFATSAAGRVRVELQGADGKPIPKFTLDDCARLAGDKIAQTVAWQAGDDVGPLAGKPVRVKFALKEGDVFSFRFGD